MKSLILATVISLGLSTPLLSQTHDKALVEKAKNAVVLLYAQDASGAMTMRCTATAFERDRVPADNGVFTYHFISAAHCVGSDDTTHEKSASATNIPFYVTFDETHAAKTFHPASVLWVGYQHRGEDFAVFEVKTREDWPTIPLGDEQQEKEGASFINIAAPLGLGKQVMYGTISMLVLDRPVIQGDINWKGALVLQLPGVQGGSSGSALISDTQQAIIGFLVGTIGEGTIIAIPVSRFRAVRKAVDAKKYKWYSPDTQLSPDGSDGVAQ